MAPSRETVDELVQARARSYSKAFTDLSPEGAASWRSKDYIYNVPPLGQFNIDYDASLGMSQWWFGTMSSMEMIEERTYGDENFTVWELFMEVTYAVDVPNEDASQARKKGEKERFRSAANIWWKWEGEGEQWDGDLSDSKEGIRGWKIYREHDYLISMYGNHEGDEERIVV